MTAEAAARLAPAAPPRRHGLGWPRPAFWLAVGLLLAPLLPVLVWSTTRSWWFPDLLPAAPDLSAWRTAAEAASGVPAALARSAGIAAVVAAAALLVGVPAGRALALHRFPGRRLVLLLVLAPLVVPTLGVAMGLHAILLRLGLAGTTAGVALVHLVPTVPYVVLVAASLFRAFDTGMEDAARTLGATPIQVLRHVTLPMLAPGLGVAALFAFLVSWSQYALTLLVGGGRVTTLPLLLAQKVAAGRADLAAVTAVIAILPGLAAVALSARLAAPGRRP